MSEEKVINQIIEYIKQGKTIGQISKILNIPRPQIKESVKEIEKAGIDLSKDSKKSEIDNQIIKLKSEGMSNNDIAKKLNIKLGALYYRLNKMENEGIILSKNEKRLEINNQILKLRAEGMTYNEIAKKLDIDVKNVNYRIKRMKDLGIDIPDLPKSRRIKSFREKDMQILQMKEEGLSQSEISKRLSISQQAISQRINEMKKCDIEIKKNKIVDEKNRQILELVKEGVTMTEIAKTLGVCYDTVYRRLKEMKKDGIQIPKVKRRRIIDEKDKEIIQLRQQGLTEQEIGFRLNLSIVSVSRRLSKIREIEASNKEKIPKNTEKYVNFSKEDIEKAILKLAKTKNATFEQMQAIANNYDIDLSRTLYSADIEER